MSRARRTASSGVRKRGELLAHHRRSDERDAVDRGRHVAHGVHALVGGDGVPRLTRDGGPDTLHLFFELFGREIGAKGGKTFQFVQRPARMAETAPRIFGTLHAERSEHRHEHERGGIGNAARRMLIGKHPARGRPRTTLAAVCHRVGQRKALLLVHAPPEHGHAESGDLRIRCAPVRHRAHKKIDLRFVQLLSALFPVDHVIHSHSTHPPPMRQKPPRTPRSCHVTIHISAAC